MQTRDFRQIAIIGTTASGKSALALELAERYHGLILSLDSLSIYRHIDIASAKPTQEERHRVPHYGIDLLDPDETFNAVRFTELYLQTRKEAIESRRPLFIVGGSSFYLKTLTEGMSPLPALSRETRTRVREQMTDLTQAYHILKQNAPHYARRIAASDRYRIEKALEILWETGKDPDEYFRSHPPVSVLRDPLPLFEIVWDRETLRKRIQIRTEEMMAAGLIDEVTDLEARYGRIPVSMKAIGIVEVLDYLDGRLDLHGLQEKIVVNTARLAKRQRTFNQSQFHNVVRGGIDTIRRKIDEYFSQS